MPTERVSKKQLEADMAGADKATRHAQSGALSQDGTQRARETAAAEAAAVWVDVGELRPWKDNPRKNDGEPVRKVAESIRRFGFGAPILARRENGEIIAGHTRWKAAKKLGMDRVPVRYLDLDPAQAHLLAVADNRVAEEAKWDDAMLGAVLAELKNAGEELAPLAMSRAHGCFTTSMRMEKA